MLLADFDGNTPASNNISMVVAISGDGMIRHGNDHADVDAGWDYHQSQRGAPCQLLHVHRYM